MTLTLAFSEVPTLAVPSPPTLFTLSSAGSGTNPVIKLAGGFPGWYGAAFKDQKSPASSGSDGDWAPRAARRSGRTMTVEGFIYGPSAASAVTGGFEFLSALFPEGHPYRVVVNDDSGVEKQVVAYAVGAIEVAPFRPGAAKFQFNLYAPDPRKYSTTLQTLTRASTGTSTGTFSNAGTAPAPLALVLPNGHSGGSGAGYVRASIGATTARFTYYVGTVAETQPVVVSLHEHGTSAMKVAAFTTGEPVWLPAPGYMEVGAGGWPFVGRGSSASVSLVLSGTTGTAARLEMRSAWW